MALASHPLSWAMLSGRRRQFLEREGARVARHCVRGGESIGRPLVLAVAAAVLPMLAGCADPVPPLTYAELHCSRSLAEADRQDHPFAREARRRGGFIDPQVEVTYCYSPHNTITPPVVGHTP